MFELLKRKINVADIPKEVSENSIEKSAAFFEADTKARRTAELENKIGSYTFTCPNCGSECKGSWHSMYGLNNLHGRTDCFTCDIHLMV